MKRAMPDISFHKGYVWFGLQLYILPGEAEMQLGVYLIPLQFSDVLPEDFVLQKFNKRQNVL